MSTLPLGQSVGLFCVASAVVLLLGVRLTRLADRFADVSGLGEAVTGAVLLGALTSLSGSVTSVTAAAGGHAELALANGLGGIVMQTAILVIADVAYRKANLEHAAASLANLLWGVMLVGLLSIVLIANVLPAVAFFGVSPATPLLLAAYAFGIHQVSRAGREPMWSPHRTDETREDVQDGPGRDAVAASRILVVVLALGVGVGVAGWVIAETGLAIAQATGMREGLVGALFTSVRHRRRSW